MKRGWADWGVELLGEMERLGMEGGRGGKEGQFGREGD